MAAFVSATSSLSMAEFCLVRIDYDARQGMRLPHGGIDWHPDGNGAIWGVRAMKSADVPNEPKMTQIVRYTHPTQAQMEAVLAEARQMRSDMIARLFHDVAAKLRGVLVGGKAPAAA